MSVSVIKSPARPGCTPVTSVFYKCEDCGDVSHSQASLTLHRSVCHNSSKSHDLSESEQPDKETDVIASKNDQIAESCECPKCGEHLLLLRPHTFNCALCDFQNEDQARFFFHLKEHYDHSEVVNVDPGSLIIEQVIDGTNPYNRNDDSDDGPDDRDDPEYVPDTDNDEDGEEDSGESKTKKPKLGISWKKSPQKKGAPTKLDYVKSSVHENSTKTANSKIGISWNKPQDKSAPKKLSFVKTPKPSETKMVDPPFSWTPLGKKDAPKKLSSERKPSAPSKTVKIKTEPEESDNLDVSNGNAMKWVRLEDIKFIGTPMAASPLQRSTYTKQSQKVQSPSKSPGLPEKPSAGNEPKKKAPKKKENKEKIPKPPPERKIPVCGICKRVFATSQGLKVHLLIHTGEKNYSCDHCGKAFTQWSTCQQHMVSIHSGVKKFTCEFCGATFARSSGLTQHRRMHTGEVLHNCNFCGKGFRCKSYLDRHRTLHTGEKRFRCEFCSKNFRTSTDMKRHRNSVHFGLGNVSLTQAKEMLQMKMDGIRGSRTPQRPAQPQRPSQTVIQRFVNDNSSNSDSEELIRATTVIAGPHFEL